MLYEVITIEMVPLAETLMSRAVSRAERLVGQILDKPFDFSAAEDYETDPDKLRFCRNDGELKERWRKELKYRVLNRYLMLMEDEGFASPGEVPKASYNFV